MKWISIEERLPERKNPEDILSVNCLVWMLHDDAPGEGIHELACYSYPRQTWLTSEGFLKHYETVTHWMPLPEAPKD
jgi:hypothetical protein